MITAWEWGPDRIGLEEMGLEPLRLGRCAGEGDGFGADVAAVYLQIKPLPEPQATDGPHRVAPTAGHIQEAQPLRRQLARQAPDGGEEAGGTAGECIDAGQAKQGCLMGLGIKAGLIHQLRPQLPLAQPTPQLGQWHRQGRLEIRGLELQTLQVGSCHAPSLGALALQAVPPMGQLGIQAR